MLTISNLTSPVGKMLRATAGLVYPTLCLSCERRVTEHGCTAELPVCSTCIRNIPVATAEIIQERLSRLPAAKGLFNSTYALWVFDEGGAIQRLQHRIKYQNQPSLGVRVGEILGNRISSPAHVYDGIIPVPLAHTRFLERGYNQSKMLADGISSASNHDIPVRTDILRRIRSTRSQTDLSRNDRWGNVHDAFATENSCDLSGKCFLVVDDILTTGATLSAAALPLRDAGASVDLAVFGVAAV